MILASEDNDFEKAYNVDDKIGKRDNIPSIIIQKSVADLIKDHLTGVKKQEKIILSVKFTGVKSHGIVEMDFFIRSDVRSALHFFKEFKNYYEKLSKLDSFTFRNQIGIQTHLQILFIQR